LITTWLEGVRLAAKKARDLDPEVKRLGGRAAAVAKSMQAYWVNFARTGDPNGPGLAP
jgi:carboxylesterase type B